MNKTFKRLLRFKDRIEFIYIYGFAMYMNAVHGVKYSAKTDTVGMKKNREKTVKQVHETMIAMSAAGFEELYAKLASGHRAFDDAYALALTFHAWFESRFNPEAVNRRGGAIGVFQFTPKGLGSLRVANGISIEMLPIGSMSKDEYKSRFATGEMQDTSGIQVKNGMDVQYQIDVIKQCAHKFLDEKRNTKYNPLAPLNSSEPLIKELTSSYTEIYWSPLGGGRINVNEANQLCEIEPSLIRRGTGENTFVFPSLLDRGVY